MKKEHVKFSAITMGQTTDWSVGRRVLNAFGDISPKLLPETLYQWEQKIGPFESVESTEPYWAYISKMRVDGSLSEFPIGLRWKRTRAVKYEAEVRHTDRNIKGDIIEGRLDIYAEPHKKIDWGGLGVKLGEAMNASVAMAHCFASFDDQKYVHGTPESAFRTLSIKDGKIPNFGWGMFLGGEFSKEVKFDLISSAGFIVKQAAEGFWIQVTEDINDVANNFTFFSRRRAELKSLFRNDLFLIKDEPDIS
ncbi:hypothetical protein KFE80_06100 [bacterium SCSIO 12696]|nr:hypothetical protein KFE80_06100 [bacterium SCSIO 12696]